MKYKCKQCKKEETTRKEIRSHVREMHGYSVGFGKTHGAYNYPYERITTSDCERGEAVHIQK